MNVRWVRCVGVWAVVTLTAAATAWWSLSGLPPVRDIDLDRHFDQLLPQVAALALIGCAAWAWLVTTVVVAHTLRAAGPHRGVPRSVPRGVPRWAVRAVLAACGVAVLTAAPGHAAGTAPGTEPGLDGLPYPDRATGLAHGRTPDDRHADPNPEPPPMVDEIVVRTGESLWSISEDRLGPRATSAELSRHAAALYALNEPVIGPDPDLIQPGQHLRTPPRRPDR